MIEYVLLGIASAVIVALLWLRTNTAICFLALCAGSVLLASSGENFSLIASSLTSGIDASTSIAKIILLFVPLICCAVLLRGHVRRSMTGFSFIPAVATALLGLIFVVPLLSESLQTSIIQTDTWSILEQYKELIVGVGLIVSIVMISITIKKPHDKHHKKGRHK